MNRRWLCISTAVVCLLTQAAFAANVFVAGQDPASTQLSAVTTDPFTFGSALSTIPGTVGVFGSTSGQKFYAIGSGSADNVAVLSGGFPYVTLGTRIQVSGPTTAGALTPDGRRLVLVGRLGTAVVDTTTDTTLLGMGAVDTGFSPNAVATSVDSRYAYVLSPGSSRVTQIDLSTNRAGATAQVPSTSTGIAVAPTGVVYVSAPGAIYELDPITLATRALITVSGTPDDLQFTPSGRYAITRDQNSSTGRSLVELDLQTRTQVTTPAGSAFSKFVLVSENLGYGLSSGNLVEVQINSSGNISQTTPSATGTIPSGIADVAASGETPGSRHLLITAGTNLYDFNLRTRDVTSTVYTGYTGYIFSVVPIGIGGVAQTSTFNQTQTVAAGTTSLPLVLGTYDTNGQPIQGVAVTFSTTTPGVTFSNSSTSTNVSGLAVTTVSVPAGASGTIPVTAAYGNRVTNYTITVGNPNLPGAGGSGGGTPTAGVPKFIPLQGQGEVLLSGFSTAFQEPLRVQYLDVNGNPVPNAQITWAVVSDVGLPINANNNGLTDTNGVSEANFTTQFLFSAATPFRQYTITATSPDGQVLTFYLTAVRTTSGGTGGLLVTPSQFNGANINLQSGVVNPGALTFQVRSALDGTPLPNVGLRLVTDTSTGRSVTCQGGPAVYSDATGTITCDLVVTGGLGTVAFTANVGGGSTLYSYTATVAAGAPAAVKIVSGNNQTVSPNQLIQPFAISVTDAANNPLSGVSVRWTIPQQAQFVNEQNVTDANGRASAQYRAPAAAGTYYFQVTSGSFSQTFVVMVGGGTPGGGTPGSGGATAVQVAGGNQQTASPGQAFAQQLQVKLVDASGRSVSGSTVSFSVTSGSASVSPATATTDANGVATATVTAGQTSGPVVITATSGNLSTTFSLTVGPSQPTFSASNVLNAASFTTGISPGSIAYIRVPGIAPNLRGSTTPNPVIGPLPTILAGVQVLVNGIAAPIYAVSNINGEESVVVQIPFETSVGSTQITVNYGNGQTTTASNVPILAVKPGIFTYTSTSDSRVYAAATRPDGTYVSPSNPARRGEIIRIFATGLGQTAVPSATNRVGVTGQSVVAPIVVGVNNAGVRLISAEMLAGEIGVYMITMEVPVDTPTGSYQPIGLGVDRPDGSGTEYANTVFIPIQ